MGSKKIKTQIYKSSIDLRNGETVDEFIDSLFVSARSLFPDSDWVWVVEVRSSAVVVSVSEQDSGLVYKDKYFELNYSRLLDGAFEFSEPVEVEKYSYWVEVR